MQFNESITAIISTSPVYCNPSTEIVDETYAQLRKHLPSVKVILLMDGVHPEQPHLADRYAGFKESMRQKQRDDFVCVEFPAWQHQSGTLQSAVIDQNLVSTPLIFWTEHDIPLSDAHIDWQGIIDTILGGELTGVQFELTGEGMSPSFQSRNGLSFAHRSAGGGWPQVVQSGAFRQYLKSFGSSKTYLENGDGDASLLAPYAVYAPSGDVCRCYHIDGRQRKAHPNQGTRKPYLEIREIGKPYVETQKGRWYVGSPYIPGQE
jgi:hypothetical protein